MIDPMDDILAAVTVRDYVCSNCWGHLQKWAQKGSRLWVVLCVKCMDQTKGFVTRYYAEARRSESIGEKMEARDLLQAMGILEPEHSGKSNEQLLKELGFD